MAGERAFERTTPQIGKVERLRKKKPKLTTRINTKERREMGETREKSPGRLRGETSTDAPPKHIPRSRGWREGEQSRLTE